MDESHQGQQCVRRSPASDRQGKVAEMLGVGTARVRAFVEKAQ
jgi:hypothetical protein